MRSGGWGKVVWPSVTSHHWELISRPAYCMQYIRLLYVDMGDTAITEFEIPSSEKSRNDLSQCRPVIIVCPMGKGFAAQRIMQEFYCFQPA